MRRSHLLGRHVPCSRPPGLAVFLPAFLALFLVAAPARPGERADLRNFFRSVQTLPLSESDEECTIAILPGSATPDGRPILFKNRDTGSVHNEVVYFTDGDYRYVAIVNAGETHRIWLGVNERGFALLNALSYNLPDTVTGGLTNGILMKWALMGCTTVNDFEALLQQTNEDGRDNPSNIGVIDAQGGAAIFEVGNHSWRRYDATDPMDAPEGFLVRTNFSLCADTSEVETHRYHRARRLIAPAIASGSADVRFILQQVARDLLSPSVDPYPLPFEGAPPLFPDKLGYVDALLTINRRSTMASGAIVGVQPGEDPLLATFYAMVGQPIVTIPLPVWVAAGATPDVLDGPTHSPLCDAAQARQARVYDDPRVTFLLNTNKLVTPEEDGYLDQVEEIETWIFPAAENLVGRWRTEGLDAAMAADWERRIAEQAFAAYMNRSRFGDQAYTLQATPNPTRGAAWILYKLNEAPPAEWSIDVFDVTGRRVARLTPAEADLSDGTLWWSGRDARGGPIAAGVYFLRPSWGGRRSGHSIVVLR